MKSVVRNTAALAAGRGTTLLISALNFVVVARELGPEKFGVYASVIAILRILHPLASCGAPLLLVQRFTEGYGFRHLPRFRRLLAATTPVLSGVALGTAYLLLPSFDFQTAGVVLLLIVSEVVMLFAHDICFAMYQSTDRMYRSVPFTVGNQALRLGGNLLLIGLGWFSLISFASVQVVASGITLYFFCSRVRRDLHPYYDGRRSELPTLRADVSLGFQYSVSLLSNSLSRDVDKTMMPQLAGLTPTGLYSLASRIVDMAFVPLISLFNVIFPRFFEAGRAGTSGVLQYILRIYRWTLTYACAATILLIVFAPAVPFVLGRDFAETSSAVQWLAPLIFIKALYYPLADSLTGLKRQALRVRIQLAAVCLNIVLNLLLIPSLGWVGAAVATLVSETALIIGMYVALLRLGERGNLMTEED